MDKVSASAPGRKWARHYLEVPFPHTSHCLQDKKKRPSSTDVTSSQLRHGILSYRRQWTLKVPSEIFQWFCTDYGGSSMAKFLCWALSQRVHFCWTSFVAHQQNNWGARQCQSNVRTGFQFNWFSLSNSCKCAATPLTDLSEIHKHTRN